MAKVLVIGASSGIGLETAKQALASGHAVRALARSAGRMAVEHPSLETFPADALESDDVARALDGVDVVVQALGVPSGPDLFFGPVRLFSESTRVLVPAMKRAGVRRLIAVTGYGAGDSRSTMGCVQGTGFRLLLGRAYDDKDAQEATIRDSDLDWTIVRPVVLTNGSRSGNYKVITDPRRWRNGLISRADVADFIVSQIADDAYIGKTPLLTY